MTKNISFTDHSDRILNRYFRDIRKYKTLDKNEEAQLILQAQQGDWQARNQITQANLAYVICVANELSNPHINVKDLIQAGNIGLMEAVSTFNPKLGYRFLTYADDCIRKRIVEEIADNFTVHIPDSEYRAMKRNKQSKPNDLYGCSNMDEEQESMFVSLDKPTRSDDNDCYTLVDCFPADNYYAPNRLCEQQSEMDYILAKIGSLPSKQAQAVRMTLGIENDFECALETIADALCVSVESARKLSKKGLTTLQKSLVNHDHIPAA